MTVQLCNAIIGMAQVWNQASARRNIADLKMILSVNRYLVRFMFLFGTRTNCCEVYHMQYCTPYSVVLPIAFTRYIAYSTVLTVVVRHNVRL